MEKRQVNWWRNPRKPNFWLVWITAGALVVFVFFSILSLIRQTPKIVIPEVVTLKILPNSENQDTVNLLSDIIDLQSPKQLYEILTQYPIIQAQETFEDFYRGRRVRWTGVVSNAFQQIMPHYSVKREDSLWNVDDLPAVEYIVDTFYEIELMHIKGGFFYSYLATEWRNLVEFLNRGDTLTIEGTLFDPVVLKKCTVVSIGKLSK